MTDNRHQDEQGAEWLERERQRLRAAYDKAGSYPKLKKKLGVNRGTLHRFIEAGEVPKNKIDREKMGLIVVSKGAQIYRDLNKIAKSQGWSSWSEYRRGVLAKEFPLTSKAVASYYKPKEKENFFDAVRADDTMPAEQKKYWLDQEN